jgi:hypothetical protein
MLSNIATDKEKAKWMGSMYAILQDGKIFEEKYVLQ